MGINHISGTAEARAIKFCTQVGCIKSQDKSPLKGAWSGSRDAFKILRPPMISQDWLKLKSSNFVHM